MQIWTLALRQWRAIAAALAILAVDTFDSFGIDQHADEQAARIVDMLAAPFYGGEARVGQKAVTVVLIDDATLAHEDWPFPIPYGDQADLVASLAAFSPAAIFLDFSYERPHVDRPGADVERDIRTFRDRLLAQSAEGGPAIFIGDVSDAHELAPLRDLPSVGVTWNARSLLTYPMTGDAGKPMAAPALYAAWCARHRAACPADWRPPRGEDLYLSWGFGQSDVAKSLRAPADDRCALPSQGFLSRAQASFERAVAALVRAAYDPRRADPMEARCTYSDTINASLILDGRFDAQIEPLIRDRVVLIGAAHRRTADRHLIPQLGIVPGVAIHAMALDNLITQGAAFTRPPPRFFLDLDWADVLEILLTVSVLALLWRMYARRGSSRHASLSAWTRITYFGYALALIGVVCIIEIALRWPALNIIGVALLIITVLAWTERDRSVLVENVRVP